MFIFSFIFRRVYKATSRSIPNKNFALKQLDVSKEKDGVITQT